MESLGRQTCFRALGSPKLPEHRTVDSKPSRGCLDGMQVLVNCGTYTCDLFSVKYT